MEANITEKAMRGIERFLERRGIEIIEHGWAHGKDKVDFIAEDEGALVFISCNIRTNDGNGLTEEEPTRKKFERIASAYLAEHPDLPESTIRHDIVSMLVLGESRALIRHHIIALSEASNDLCKLRGERGLRKGLPLLNFPAAPKTIWWCTCRTQQSSA